MVEIGDVYRMKTGEGLLITQLVPGGEFTAQVQHLTGEWSNDYLRGEADKLPEFLKANEAVKEQTS